MSEPYYPQPLGPQPGQWHDRQIDPTEVSDVAADSPSDDPTVPGSSPRGAPYPAPRKDDSAAGGPSREAQNQQATSAKSRAESGTP